MKTAIRCLLLASAAFCALPLVAAPIVAGFDRFGDTIDAGVSPGLLLYNELKCGACHGVISAKQGAFPSHSAPNLANVGERVRLDYLKAFIAKPHAVKSGTTMPSLFANWNEDESALASEALAHFLVSLSGDFQADTEAPVPAQLERGSALFHSVGCVACHAPVEAVPTGGATEDIFGDLEEVVEAQPIRVPSVPLPDFSAKTSASALASFLRDPSHARPGGRMPNMTLSQSEATAIAGWLVYGQEGAASSNAAAVGQQAGYDPAKAESGRALFQQMGCASCHQIEDTNSVPAAPPLSGAASWTDGCLSDTSTREAPWFNLNPAQRTALRGLATGAPGGEPTPTDRINHTLLALNCYACHERNGLGGPEPGRAAYFAETEVLDLGDEGRLPPTLTAVGSKLTPEWLTAILTDGGRVRPYMATRMPHFGDANVAPLAAALLEVDKDPVPLPTNVTGLEHHQRAHYGRELMGTEGLGCVTCHNLKGKKSLGIPAVDLAFVPDRLQPAWFKRYMLDPNSLRPGTRMPAFFIEGKSQGSKLFNADGNKQIEALWIYLREVMETRLPIGMEKTDDYELKPVSRPVIHRTFVKDVGTHAIAVGFPEGIHFVYDALHMRPAAVWRGRFIDAESAQADRFTPFVKPLGKSLVMLGKEGSLALTSDGSWDAEALQYTGYRLDASRTPVFTYRFGEVAVEESLRPTDDGKAFLRRLEFTGPPQALYLRIGKGDRVGEAATYTVGKVNIEITAGPPAIAGSEVVGWLLPVEVTETGTSIEQVISW